MKWKWEFPIFPASLTLSLQRMEPHISHQKVKVYPKWFSINLNQSLTAKWCHRRYIYPPSRKNFTKVNKILNKTRSIDESHFFLLPLSIFGVTLPFKLLHGWIKPIYLKAINVRRLYPNYLCKAIQRSREQIIFFRIKF